MTRLFIAVYLVEAGLILAAAPWTEWWRFNYFADLLPWLRALMSTQGMQMLVVFIGVVTALVGLVELWSTLAGRFGRRRPSSEPFDS